MLNHVWRVIFLLVTLVLLIWPTLLGTSTRWIALIAVLILLIGELTHKSYKDSHSSHHKSSRKKSRSRKRR